MTDSEFVAWASCHRVPEMTIDELLCCAASPEEMQETIDEMEPPPPIYPLGDIVEMTDKDPYGFSASANGFIIVGGCPNGDPIAVDVSVEPGSVWYICHETMFAESVREVSVRVAKDFTELLSGLAAGGFPIDFFEAKKRR